MYRLMTACVATLTLVAVPARTVRADEHEMHHAAHFMACAKACAECQLQCDSCYKHCLMMLTEGKKEHAKTVQSCVDCAEFCKTAASLSGRMSHHATFICDGCAKMCDECAMNCEKFPDDKHMAACAKSCRDCAKACREMMKRLAMEKDSK